MQRLLILIFLLPSTLFSQSLETDNDTLYSYQSSLESNGRGLTEDAVYTAGAAEEGSLKVVCDETHAYVSMYKKKSNEYLVFPMFSEKRADSLFGSNISFANKNIEFSTRISRQEVEGMERPLLLIRWEFTDDRKGDRELSGLQLWDVVNQRNYFDEVTHRYEYDESKAGKEEGGDIECQSMIRFEKTDMVILKAECNPKIDGGIYEIIGKNHVRTKALKNKHWDLMHHMSPND